MFFEQSRFGIKKVILAGLGVILGHLGAILGPLGPNLGRFGRPRGSKREAKRDPRGTKNETKMTSKFRSILRSILGRSWANKRGQIVWGAAVLATSVAPPRDFLRKYLPSRDLKSLLIDRDIAGGLQHAVPCFAGGGGLKERFARPPPPPFWVRPL